MALFCIKGTGSNNAKILWVAYQLGFDPPSSRSFGTVNSGASLAPRGWINGWSKFSENLKAGVDYPCNQIHEDLKSINDGEIKIAIYIGSFSGDGKPSSLNVFLMLNAKAFCGYNNGNKQFVFFPTTVIFTPKPELFDETPPN